MAFVAECLREPAGEGLDPAIEVRRVVSATCFGPAMLLMSFADGSLRRVPAAECATERKPSDDILQRAFAMVPSKSGFVLPAESIQRMNWVYRS